MKFRISLRTEFVNFANEQIVEKVTVGSHLQPGIFGSGIEDA